MVRVFHGPNNVAGAAELLARAQRDFGYDARSICFDGPQFSGPVDQQISLNVRGRISLLLAARQFDVFHFYFGNTLFAGLGLQDVRLLKSLGKKVFMYFCGCDIRDSKSVIENQHFSACANCWPQKCHPRRDELESMLDDFDGVFVSTPDLLEFAPKATWLPQPIDLELLSKIGQEELSKKKDSDSTRRIVRVAHAPSSRSLKGTSEVRQAIEALQRRGHEIELILIEGRTYKDALSMCASADIAIDQLLIGSYGQFSVEAMALGLPVICYIRDDLRSHYPATLPIVSATPSNIIDVLTALVTNPSSWDDLSKSGKTYVQQHHSSEVVGRIASAMYSLP